MEQNEATAAGEDGSPAVDDNQFTVRAARDYVGIVLRGFFMGSADVVPGVSGGTMALILGIYEELIMSIRMVGQPEFWRPLLRFRIGEALKAMNAWFLAAVFAGIMIAVILLAPAIEYTLEHQPIYLWSFFFGLVSASVIVVGRRIPKWHATLWITFILGTVFAYWIVGLVPVQTPETWWFLMLSGALAACAMILPGISGSFILLLLGKYEFVINAVNQRDLVSIALIGIGAVIGLVTLAQLLSWLFKRYHDLTIALLTGFMLGSLRKIWPWKETVETFVDRHGEVVPLVQKNVLPALQVNSAFNTEVLFALGIAIVGFIVVLILERVGRRSHSAAA